MPKIRPGGNADTVSGEQATTIGLNSPSLTKYFIGSTLNHFVLLLYLFTELQFIYHLSIILCSRAREETWIL